MKTNDDKYDSEDDYECEDDNENSESEEEKPPKKRKARPDEDNNQPIIVLLSTGPERPVEPKKQKKEHPAKLKKELKDKEQEIFKFTSAKSQDLSLRERVLLSKMPLSLKSEIVCKLDGPKMYESDNTRYTNWVNEVLKIPYGKHKTLPCSMKSPLDTRIEYLDSVKTDLDNAVYGNENAKDEIIDFVARKIANPQSSGNIIALVGSAGTGKTQIIRNGLSKALDLPFHQISFGGLNDTNVLVGSDSVYVGSKYGRVAQIMMESGCMNPVIYLDEIDKLSSESSKGAEISGILIHMLDETQNMEFSDVYLGSAKLDLSKVLFVLSLNDLDQVNPILRDRLKVIKIDSPTITEKVQIAKRHIIPELNKILNMKITISDDILKYIITNKLKEDGVRSLRKSLETILQKLNTSRVKGIPLPESVDRDTIDKILKNKTNENLHHFYI